MQRFPSLLVRIDITATGDGRRRALFSLKVIKLSSSANQYSLGLLQLLINSSAFRCLLARWVQVGALTQAQR